MKLSVQEFNKLNRLLEDKTGILLNSSKIDIMANRLLSRIRSTKCKNYTEYYQLVISAAGVHELPIFIDKLTTHETYFFRESAQFEFLHSFLKDRRHTGSLFRAWSAAASTGEEAYSIAMVLESSLRNTDWEILGTDISETAVEIAREALYSLTVAEKIPAFYRQSFCLKGTGTHAGTFTLTRHIKERCEFRVENLLTLLSVQDKFDAIFLRNVLIYFDAQKQAQILDSIINRLNYSGLLFLGHSEGLREKRTDMKPVSPCIYQKVKI